MAEQKEEEQDATKVGLNLTQLSSGDEEAMEANAVMSGRRVAVNGEKSKPNYVVF
jgi:hypothetical protein